MVGGGYGVAVGDVFCTESQFSAEANASKLGFTVLNWHLAKKGFVLNDGKYPTPTTIDMGFRLIPRSEYREHLRQPATTERTERWQVEAQPEVIADWQPAQSLPR
jgi:leucyl/phenylalanyl-tRNA--protein transferase